MVCFFGKLFNPPALVLSHNIVLIGLDKKSGFAFLFEGIRQKPLWVPAMSNYNVILANCDRRTIVQLTILECVATFHRFRTQEAAQVPRNRVWAIERLGSVETMHC